MTKEVDNRTRSNRQGFAGCAVKALLGILLLGVVLFFIQQAIKPDVEDNTTVSIGTVQASEGGSENAGNDSSADSNRLVDSITNEQVKSSDHPLDPLMTLADKSLQIIDEKYFDYSAKMLSQVQTGNKLHEENTMFLKVRHQRTIEAEDTKTEIPFSIYTRFLSPESKVGNEAIWVKDRDDNRIVGHGTGLLNFKILKLKPESGFAMKGNRYPIYQIGFRNLIVKMKEFGENDRKYGECEVEIVRNLLVDERPCTMLKITHPVKRDHFDYHIAKIYIDDEYEIPTGYEGYLWPENAGDDPPLLEKYFYLELKLNAGLKDFDFDVSNPDYNYPRWGR